MYPEDVAYAIGGEGNAQYIILEMHYDNPNLDSGEHQCLFKCTVDNSHFAPTFRCCRQLRHEVHIH